MKTPTYILIALVLFVFLWGIANSHASTSTNTDSSPTAIADGTPLPALTVPAGGAYRVLGKPTIGPHMINQVLAAYGSPAAGTGQTLYDLGEHYGIDPIYALAFFLHESKFGTTGEARSTLSLGNERCINDRPCIDQARGGYAQMESWTDGYAHWYMLIRAYASGEIEREQTGHRKPLVTLAEIIPVYAPSSDGNNVRAYIRAIEQAVTTWRAGKIFV